MPVLTMYTVLNHDCGSGFHLASWILGK